MIIVTCVLTGNKYSEEDVYRLRDNVYKHLTQPFRFICLSDRDINGCETVIIDEPYYSPWDKMFLFCPGYLPEGNKLYFDLDVKIQNNIDCLVKDKITGVRCYWKEPRNNPHSKNPALRHDTDLNTSVMSWSEDLTHVWDFYEDNEDYFQIEFGGTDRFLFWLLNWDAYPKGLIFSRAHGTDIGVEPNDIVDGWYGFKDPDALVCLYNGEGKRLMQLDLRMTSPTNFCQE